MANSPRTIAPAIATQSRCWDADKAKKGIYGIAVTLVALGVLFGALILIFQHYLLDWGPFNGLIHSFGEYTFVPLALSGSLLLLLIGGGIIWKQCSDSSVTNPEQTTSIETPVQSAPQKPTVEVKISIDVARQGDLATIQSALKAGGISNLSALLFHAALAGHSEIVSELLQAGADPSCSDEPTSAMHEAIKCSDTQKSLQTMEVLLNHSPQLASQQFRKSRLSPSRNTQSDNPQTIKPLRITLRLRSPGALTPLHVAVTSESPIEKIDLLLKYGANVNAQDERGDTPLMELIGPGYRDPNRKVMEVIERLIEAGATLSENHKGETFVSLAQKHRPAWFKEPDVQQRLKALKIIN